MTAAWRELFPMPVRQLLNAVWPERWTQAETDAIRREARAEWRRLGGVDMSDSGPPTGG